MRKFDMNSRPCGSPPLRPAFMLIEMLVSLILLGTVAVMIPIMLRSVYQQRSMERYHRLSQLELGNISARLRGAAADDLSASEETAVPELSVWFVERYPNATLTIDRLPESARPAGLDGFRLVVSRGDENRPLSSTRQLTVWSRVAAAVKESAE